MIHVLFLLRRSHLYTEDDKNPGDRAQEAARDTDGLLSATWGVFVLQFLHQRAQQSVDKLQNMKKMTSLRNPVLLHWQLYIRVSLQLSSGNGALQNRLGQTLEL